MNTDTLLSSRVTVVRLIVLSLVVGIVAFAAIVSYLQISGTFPGVGMPTVTYLGLGMLALALVIRPLFLTTITKAARQQMDPNDPSPQPWLNLFATRSIIGCALLEGAAFLCGVGALLHGEPLGLAGAAAGAIAMLAFHFPSEARAESFINEQRELAIQERMNG